MSYYEIELARMVSIVDKKYHTLMTKNLPRLQIRTVGDLLRLEDVNRLRRNSGFGEGKIKLIKVLRELLQSYAYAYEASVKDGRIDDIYLPFSILPSTAGPDDKPAEVFRKFINDFCERVPNSRVPQNKKNVIKYAYIDGLERALIAENSYNTRQNVDLILNRFGSFIHERASAANFEVAGSARDYGFSFGFTQQFVDVFTSAKDLADKCPTAETFAAWMGCRRNDPIFAFILNCLQKKICSNIRAELVDDYVSGINANQMGDAFGVVFDKLDEEVKPYDRRRLQKDIRRVCTNIEQKVIDTVCHIIESSPQFEVINGIEYQLTWKELKSSQTRVERILYEMGMEKATEDIKNEYNRRLDVAGLNRPKDINFRSSDKIVATRPDGWWIWCEFVSNDTSFATTRDRVRQFVAQNKAVKMELVYNHIAQFIEDYNDRTIRSYVTEFCYETDEGYYVYKNCRNEFTQKFHFLPQPAQLLEELVNMLEQNKYYTTTAIKELYEKTYSLIGGRQLIYNVCHKNPNFFETINHGGRNPSEWRLRLKKREILNQIHSEQEARNRTIQHRDEHMKECRMEAVNTLAYANDYRMPMKDLVFHLKEFMPSGIKQNSIYKIFEQEIFIKDDSLGKKNQIVKLNLDVYRKEFKESLEAGNENTDKREANALNATSNNNDVDILYNLRWPDDYNTLKEAVLAEVTGDINKIATYENMGIDFNRAWDKMLQIMNIEHEGFDGVFRRLFTRLYRYLNGHTNHIECFDLYRDLNLDFEKYLCTLLNIETKGLKTVIIEAQQHNLLPQRDYKCTLTNYTSWLISHRNELSHTGGKTRSIADLARDINRALILFLYVAHKANTIM